MYWIGWLGIYNPRKTTAHTVYKAEDSTSIAAMLIYGEEWPLTPGKVVHQTRSVKKFDCLPKALIDWRLTRKMRKIMRDVVRIVNATVKE